MKSGTCKPSQKGKPPLSIVYSPEVPARHLIRLPVQQLLDAWLCQPIQPKQENYLHILRNRRN